MKNVTEMIDTSGGSGRGASGAGQGGGMGGGRMNIGGMMNIQQLDQGISRLRERSDRIKKREANNKDLEEFEQDLRDYLIVKDGLSGDKKKPLKDYVYDDLCNGVI